MAYEHDTYTNAVKTWRYLRLAMIVLVVGLGVSIGIEFWKAGRKCLQTSISAYYYTPVRGFFVGSLLAIGVCLVCLKGNTAIEDVLLNLAGGLAPVVALVPIANPGDCASHLGSTADRTMNVTNNVPALLAVAASGLFLGVLISGRTAVKALEKREIRGLVSTVVVLVVAAVVYLGCIHLFLEGAHFAAAGPMFVLIFFVVRSNAGDKDVKPRYRKAYEVIAWAMVVAAVGAFAGHCLFGWQHWIFAVEAALIVLFAVFWGIQTREMYHCGLRHATPPGEVAPTAPTAAGS